MGLVPGFAERRHRLPVGAAGPEAASARPRCRLGQRRHHRRRPAPGPARQRVPPRRARAHPGGLRAGGAATAPVGAPRPTTATATPTAAPRCSSSVFLTGVYGGYFGAAQGVILMSLLGIFFADHLQRLNAGQERPRPPRERRRRRCSSSSFAHVAWEAAGLVAAGSVVGGQVGRRPGPAAPRPAAAGGHHRRGRRRRAGPARLIAPTGRRRGRVGEVLSGVSTRGPGAGTRHDGRWD